MKVDSEEQFGISFEGRVKNIFGDKGNFSRERGNTDPLGGPALSVFSTTNLRHRL